MMTLKLYKNFPINDYENQIAYIKSNGDIDTDKRNDVFDTYTDKTFKNLSSCDKTKQTIRLDIDYYVGNKYNYGCIIENDKRYYIFIDIVEWLSNHTVILHYTYDYWQTYCDRVKLKQSFVEREHVNNDQFGLHLIDEGLPISDYLINGNENIDYKANDICFCIALSDNSYIWDSSLFTRNMGLYWENGTGLQLLTVGFDNNNFEDAMKTIQYYVANNKIDSIQGFYYAPVKSTNRISCAVGKENDLVSQSAFVVTPNTTYEDTNTMTRNLAYVRHNTQGQVVDSYTPNNNKCYIYPYQFVNITNYLGSNIYAKFEFTNDLNTVKLAVNFPTTEGSSPTCYLKNYDGLTHALDYNMSSFVNPELPFVTNQYSAYLSANTNSINNTKSYIDSDYELGLQQSTENILDKTLSGLLSTNLDIGGALASPMRAMSGARDLSYAHTKAMDSINASLADQASKGDIAHGAFIPSTLTNIGRCGFQMQRLQVTPECIRTIDHYLSMFGYKVNIIKTPQFNSRKRWNYLKTSGVNVIGNVPQDALNVIKNMFNEGVTMWHNAKTMYDYAFNDNDIVR